MAGIWDEFDAMVNTTELDQQLKEARNNTFEDLPAGDYVARLESLEMKKSKTGKAMVSIRMGVVEGKYKNRKMFMNRVISGTRNDARMIAGTETWLKKLEAEDEQGDLIVIQFHTYSQFNDLIMDIEEAVDDMGLVYDVHYDKDEFNCIEILGVCE